MPHLLAGRPKAVAERWRVVAPLVGVLALVLALFAMTAPAGAKARHATKPPADKAAQKHDDAAGQPKDKDQGQAKDEDKDQGQAKDEDKDHGQAKDEDKKQGQPKDKDDNEGKPKHDDENQGKAKDEDKNQGKPKHDEDKDHEAGCDSSGPGNPCHPPQQCGENSGPGNANDTCPAGNPECPGADEGQGNVAGAKVKLHHKVKAHHKQQKAKHDKAKHHKVNKDEDDDAANCPPPVKDKCEYGKVKNADGMCIPIDECKAHGGVVQDDKCVQVEDKCEYGKVKNADGMCIPIDECTPPNVVIDGECKQPVNNEGCPAGTVQQGNQCVNQTPVCVPPAVLQGNVCVTPTTTVAGQQATQPAAQTPAQPAPASTVAGTQARSATARLRTQSRCGTRAFRVTISGRNIRRVTLFVAGRRVRTVTMPAGRRSITVSVPVRRFGARRQSVRARVTFRNGAAARTLTASATRCAQTAVSPQFTG
jgi:hypothetical protein